MESESHQLLRQQLESLNEVSKTLRQCQSIAKVVQKALAEVRSRLNVQVASIFLLSKDGVLKREGIDGVDQEGNPIDNSWFAEEQYEPGESFSGKPVPPFDAESSYGKPQYSDNLVEEYSLIYARRYIEKLGDLRCGISVPLNGFYKTFGTLEILNKQDENGLSQEDVYWLMIIGTSVANFIVDFRRKKRLEAYKQITEKLIDLEVTDKNFDLQNFYQLVADKLTADFTPYKACIIRIADEKDDLEIRGKSSNLEDNIFWQGRKDASIKAGSQIVGEVYKTIKPMFICNIDDVEIQKFNNKEWVRKRKLQSMACLPLSVQDKCVGTISVYTQYPHKFSDNYKFFLENMAFLTAAITARIRLINTLRQVRQERNEIRERLLNTSLLVGVDSLSEGILHQYKNELINFYQFLEKILSSKVSNQEKERFINEQKEWVTKRVEQLQLALKTDEEISAVDINKVIREVVRSFSFEFSDVDIKIEIIYDDKIPLIGIDSRKIKDIIFNLLSNSEKAIHKAHIKEGKIVLTTSIDKSELISYIQITIEDNGVGISSNIQERIFQKGFTTRKEEGGTGLGLFLVQKIINNYGGKIYFNSIVNEGTKFYIKIPLKRYLL